MAFTLHVLDGAETGGLERVDVTSGSPYVSPYVRESANGQSCYAGQSGSFRFNAFAYQGSNQGTGNVVGGWFKNFTNSTNGTLLSVYDEDNTDLMVRIILPSTRGTMWIYDSANAFGGTATLYETLVADKWYYIEFYWESSATGAWELFLGDESTPPASMGSGVEDFASNGIDPGYVYFPFKGVGVDTTDSYWDDTYFGTGAASSADRLGGMDIFSTTGDGSATTGGDTLDAGTWPNIQEIPKNDTNLASYNAPTGNTDEREAPTSIAVQTNLTGAVTDIDDDPDSPDGLWLTASGSSTLRALMANPTGPPTIGAGLQEFRVLMRKDATGPAGGGTEDVLPTGLVTQTGFTGAVTVIDDDPDAPDGDTAWSGNNGWMTHTADGGTLQISMANPTNGANIDTATDAQIVKVFLRKDATGGGTPTFTLEVHDSGGLHETLATAITCDTAGTLYTYNWTAAGISSPDDIEIKLVSVKGGGGPNTRSIEIDAVRWEMVYTGVETQPGYEIKLYENGSEVVAAGSATGTLTDAGGDTVVSFTWDATNLGTADGSLVECYVNQTSGADRYIEIGAVEWNCKYPVAKPAESGWIEANSGANQGPLNHEAVKIYYFDESDDAGAGTNWQAPDRGFDGSNILYTWIIDPNVNVLHGGGTNAPITGGTVSQVRARWKYRKEAAFTSVKCEWWTDGKSESLGSDTQTTITTGAYTGWVNLSVPTGGWTWAKIAALELEVTPVYNTGAGNCGIYISEVEVTAAPATALNEIIALSTYIRTQYTGSGSTLDHSLYRGNDVDGVTELALGNATAALADFFDLTESATIVPLITEQTRVGFGHPVNVDVDIDCTEIIGMVAHIPFISGDVAFTTITEVIAITENIASVNRARDVGCVSEAIVITEPDTTILFAKDVICSPELIAITENDAIINSERNVIGISEIIAITEPDSNINTSRIVTGVPEIIAVIENNSNINTSRIVTGVPELIAITEPDATIDASIPLVVNCTPELISILENDSAVSFSRLVSTTPEIIFITESDATINRTRNVTTDPELIAVIENDATILAGANLDVNCTTEIVLLTENDALVSFSRNITTTPELIAVLENDAIITRGFNVATIPEQINVIENPATITLSRGVNGIPEVIYIIESQAFIIRGGVIVRRVIIVS